MDALDGADRSGRAAAREYHRGGERRGPIQAGVCTQRVYADGHDTGRSGVFEHPGIGVDLPAVDDVVPGDEHGSGFSGGNSLLHRHDAVGLKHRRAK